MSTTGWKSTESIADTPRPHPDSPRDCHALAKHLYARLPEVMPARRSCPDELQSHDARLCIIKLAAATSDSRVPLHQSKIRRR
ncbi:hypothetical protein AAL_08344 [Moelleriella libera RCEF 2490]|uniref:Uncharacterized protein n=1 Tax=Moelleriella libera RCEF 2490 TaxID=1081109 RepID=A0A167VKV6_9HYPO|nr:hypothetical protein AAL_08344 [Moelleriella libera RCEF 2490]